MDRSVGGGGVGSSGGVVLDAADGGGSDGEADTNISTAGGGGGGGSTVGGGGGGSSGHHPDAGEEGSNQHPARRPMNAFLLFCKKHRKQVREKFPHLENRQVTKILGEWWAELGASEKNGYQELARQLKEAFLRANPDFKWYKIPSQPPRPPPARPSNQKVPRHQQHPTTNSAITFGKLADETLMGRLSTLLSPAPSPVSLASSLSTETTAALLTLPSSTVSSSTSSLYQTLIASTHHQQPSATDNKHCPSPPSHQYQIHLKHSPPQHRHHIDHQYHPDDVKPHSLQHQQQGRHSTAPHSPQPYSPPPPHHPPSHHQHLHHHPYHHPVQRVCSPHSPQHQDYNNSSLSVYSVADSRHQPTSPPGPACSASDANNRGPPLVHFKRDGGSSEPCSTYANNRVVLVAASGNLRGHVTSTAYGGDHVKYEEDRNEDLLTSSVTLNLTDATVFPVTASSSGTASLTRVLKPFVTSLEHQSTSSNSTTLSTESTSVVPSTAIPPGAAALSFLPVTVTLAHPPSHNSRTGEEETVVKQEFADIGHVQQQQEHQSFLGVSSNIQQRLATNTLTITAVKQEAGNCGGGGSGQRQACFQLGTSENLPTGDCERGCDLAGSCFTIGASGTTSTRVVASSTVQGHGTSYIVGREGHCRETISINPFSSSPVKSSGANVSYVSSGEVARRSVVSSPSTVNNFVQSPSQAPSSGSILVQNDCVRSSFSGGIDSKNNSPQVQTTATVLRVPSFAAPVNTYGNDTNNINPTNNSYGSNANSTISTNSTSYHTEDISDKEDIAVNALNALAQSSFIIAPSLSDSLSPSAFHQGSGASNLNSPCSNSHVASTASNGLYLSVNTLPNNSTVSRPSFVEVSSLCPAVDHTTQPYTPFTATSTTGDYQRNALSSVYDNGAPTRTDYLQSIPLQSTPVFSNFGSTSDYLRTSGVVSRGHKHLEASSSESPISDYTRTTNSIVSCNQSQEIKCQQSLGGDFSGAVTSKESHPTYRSSFAGYSNNAQEKTSSPWSPSAGLHYNSSAASVHQGSISPVSSVAVTIPPFANMTPPMPPKKRYTQETMLRPKSPTVPVPTNISNSIADNNSNSIVTNNNDNNHKVNSADGLPLVKSSKHTHWRKPALQAAVPSTIVAPPTAALSATPPPITCGPSVPSPPYSQCTVTSLNHSPHHTLQDGVSSASQVSMYAMNHHPSNSTSHASMHSPSHYSTLENNHTPASIFSNAAPYTTHHTTSLPRTIYYSTHPSSPLPSSFSTAAHSPPQPAVSYSSSSQQMTTSQAATPLSTTRTEVCTFPQHRPIVLAHHSPIVTPAVGQFCHSHHQPQLCSSSTISPQEPASHLIPKISVFQRTVENNDLERMQRQLQPEQPQQRRISEQTSEQRRWLQDSRVSETLGDRLPSVQEANDEEQPLNLKMVSTTKAHHSTNNRAENLLFGANATAYKPYGRHKPYSRRKTPSPGDAESRPGSTRRQKVVATEQNANRTTGNGSPLVTVERHASVSYSVTPPHLSPACSPSHLNNVVPSQSKHSVARNRYYVGGYDSDDVFVESIEEPSSHHQAKHARGSSAQQVTARLADRPSSSPSTDNSLSSTASASSLPMGEVPSSPSTGAGSSVEGDHDKLIERVIVESLERNSIDEKEELRKFIEFCNSDRGVKLGVVKLLSSQSCTENNVSLIAAAERHANKGKHSSSGGVAGNGPLSGRLINRSRTLQKRTSSPRSESSSNSPVPSSNPPSAPATPPAVAVIPPNTATDACVRNVPSPVVVSESRRNIACSSLAADLNSNSVSPIISNHRTRSSTVLTPNKIGNLPRKNINPACRIVSSNTINEKRKSPSPVIGSRSKRTASSPVVLAENHPHSPPSPVITIEDECHIPPTTALSSITGHNNRKCPVSPAACNDYTLISCNSTSDQFSYDNGSSSDSVSPATTAAAKDSKNNCSPPIEQSPALSEAVPQSSFVVSCPSPSSVPPPLPTTDPIELTPVQQQLLVEFTIAEGLKRQTINYEKEALQFQIFCQSDRAAQVGIVPTSQTMNSTEHINRSLKSPGHRIATAAANIINTTSPVADAESVAANNTNDRSSGEQNKSISGDAANESTLLLPLRSGGTRASSKDVVSIGGSENYINNNSNSGSSSTCGVSAVHSINRTLTTSNIPQKNVHRGNNYNSSSDVMLVDDVSNDNHRGISEKDSQVRHAASVVGSSSGVSSSSGKSRVGAAVAEEALAPTGLPRRQSVYEGLERHPRKRKADSDRDHLVLPKRVRGRSGAGGDGGRGGGAGGGGRASRACKGKRYQELMDEGLLQSARRTRARQATARTDETGKEGSEGPDRERLRSPPPPHRLDDSPDRADPSSRRTARLLDSPTLPQQPRVPSAAPASTFEQDEQGVGEGVLSAPHRGKGAGRWEVGGDVVEDVVEEVVEAVNQHTKFLPEGPGNWLFHHQQAATSSVYSTLALPMEESPVVSVSTANMAAMIEKPPPALSSVPAPNAPQQPQTGRSGSGTSSTSVSSKRSSGTGGAAAAPNKQYQPDNFDLDAKIEALPYLSFDDFTSRKKEHKRKTSSSTSARSTAAAGSGSTAAIATVTAAATAGSAAANSLRGGEKGVGGLDGEASLTTKPNGYLSGSSLPSHQNHSGGKSSGGGVAFRHQSSTSHSAASSSSHDPSEAGSGSNRHDPSRLLLSSGVVYHHHSAPPHSSGESAVAARVTAAGSVLSPSSKLSSPGGETPACQPSTSFSSGEGSFSGEECGGGEVTPLTGSQKRKARKQIITRRDPLSSVNHNAAVVDPGVLSSMGLQTLAEVALQHPTMRT